jgi:hypothetical protein
MVSGEGSIAGLGVTYLRNAGLSLTGVCVAGLNEQVNP